MLRTLAFVAAIAISTLCFAGPFKNGDGAGHFGKFKRAVKELNLTDQQKIQMREIIKSAKAEARENLSSLLTAEQRQQLEKLKVDFKASKKQGRQ